MALSGDISVLENVFSKKRLEAVLLFFWLVIMFTIISGLHTIPKVVAQLHGVVFVVSAVIFVAVTLILKHRFTRAPFKQES